MCVTIFRPVSPTTIAVVVVDVAIRKSFSLIARNYVECCVGNGMKSEFDWNWTNTEKLCRCFSPHSRSTAERNPMSSQNAFLSCFFHLGIYQVGISIQLTVTSLTFFGSRLTRLLFSRRQFSSPAGENFKMPMSWKAMLYTHFVSHNDC